ncbi:MAG: hypothetical protein GXP48_06170 [Acidobacteria bacterium]|nr:hypothetical protein [Acidobacteriota bacterium]
MSRLTRGLLLGTMLGVLALPHGAAAATKPVRSRLDHHLAKMEAALATSIKEPTTFRGMRIDVQGFLGGGLRSLSVYGRGFGVWNRGRQFKLTKDQIRSCLKVLEAYHFTSMPARIGAGELKEGGTLQEKRGDNVTQMIRSVTLTVAGMSKTVEQDNEAPESKAFKKMVAAIVTVCRPAAAKGMTAKDLQDGLEKIASGALAPELLLVSINAPELRSLKSQDGQGWKLTIANARLTAQRWTLRNGPAAPVRRWLSEEEIRSLAHVLATSHAASLPGNLDLPGYLQLSISVLNHGRTLMARRYASRSGPKPAELRDYLHIRKTFFMVFEAAVARQHHLPSPSLGAKGSPEP